MSIDKRKLKVGDELLIQITGVVGDFQATVTGHDTKRGEAIVEVTDEGSWKGASLKREDYVVVEAEIDGEVRMPRPMADEDYGYDDMPRPGAED
jgi:hypothetical protein